VTLFLATLIAAGYVNAERTADTQSLASERKLRDDFHYDMNFVRALTKAKLYDWVELQLTLMAGKYRDHTQTDAMNLEKARAYYAMNRRKRAAAALAEIPADSFCYRQAQLLQGEQSYRHRQFPEALVALDVFLAPYREKGREPVLSGLDDGGDFRKAVMLRVSTLRELGKPDAAQALQRFAGHLERLGNHESMLPAE